MKILKLVTALKGDTFVAGDRIAVDSEKGTMHVNAKTWWTGTVVSISGTKIVIKHDDDGSDGTYPYSRTQTSYFYKLKKGTKKITTYVRFGELKPFLAPSTETTPANKPANTVPKISKNVAYATGWKVTISLYHKTYSWEVKSDDQADIESDFYKSGYDVATPDDALTLALKYVKPDSFLLKLTTPAKNIELLTLKKNAAVTMKALVSTGKIGFSVLTDEQVSMYARYEKALKTNDPVEMMRLCKPPTETAYKADPIVGYIINTGRAASTTARSVSLGFSFFKGSIRAVSCATNGSLLYSKNNYGRGAISSVDDLTKDSAASRTGQRHSYASYLSLLNEATNKRSDHEERKAVNLVKSDDARTQFWGKFTSGSCEAYIAFSNITTWKGVVEISYEKGVGIQGSGTKLRWIPWSYVKDMRASDKNYSRRSGW